MSVHQSAFVLIVQELVAQPCTALHTHRKSAKNSCTELHTALRERFFSL